MRILIIEDDTTLAQAIAFGLEKEGHTVIHAPDGTAGETAATGDPRGFDLIILDLMLPHKDGVAVCQSIRNQGIAAPILILTGKDGIDDKVRALNSGADDYLTKPFSLPELMARVHALLRRPRHFLPSQLSVNDFVLNTEKRTLLYRNEEIPLTLKEFAILEYLMRHPNQVLTREQILDHVWDYNFDSFSNIVDVHINNLRKKINNRAAEAKRAMVLETIRGVGYCVKAT